MSPDEVQSLVEEATFDFVSGDPEVALAKLGRATQGSPGSFDAWHAKAEILFSLRRFDDALAAAEKAHELHPDDPLAVTTLSRIWMEKGDKAKAEHYGAQARMRSWKEELRSPVDPDADRLR